MYQTDRVLCTSADHFDHGDPASLVLRTIGSLGVCDVCPQLDRNWLRKQKVAGGRDRTGFLTTIRKERRAFSAEPTLGVPPLDLSSRGTSSLKGFSQKGRKGRIIKSRRIPMV